QTEVGRAHALAPDAAHLHPQEGAPEPAPRGRDRRSGVDMQLRRRAEILRRGRRVHRRVGQHLPDHLVRRARRHSSDAGAVRTRVADGAGVAVVAREAVRAVHAAPRVVAAVGGALVPVVAVELGATDAVAVDARVTGGAGVAVVAGARLGAAALALAGAVTGHGVDALLRGARRASRLEPTGRRAAVA